jgi:hypothetical protein
MSDLFKTHLITVYKNDIKNVPGSRNPTSGYTEIAKHIKCHIGRTGPSGSILKLHVLKQELEKLPDTLHRGFKIKDEENNAEYVLSEIPIWGGGMKHHIECALEEFK